jgi:hypothetical protein
LNRNEDIEPDLPIAGPLFSTMLLPMVKLAKMFFQNIIGFVMGVLYVYVIEDFHDVEYIA